MALSLLHESWGPLVVNLNGMKDSWSLEWIRAQVLQEEFRRKELTAAVGEGGGSAYGMKGFKGHGGKAKEGSRGEQYSGGKAGNKGGKRCGGKCWYCHVEGHPWFKCRKLPDGWRPGQPSIEGSKGVHRAMGEGMGSEEGDGGAGGHGGMFYHVSHSRLPRFLTRLRRRALLASRVGSALPLTPPRSFPQRLPSRPCTWTLAAAERGSRATHRPCHGGCPDLHVPCWCPQFLWPQAVRYAAHQLKPWPSDARPWVTLVSLWTGSSCVTADFYVWGSLAHVCALGANKLSLRTRVCIFLGFPLDTAGWVFYDPLTYEFFYSQDITFDESVCYYRSRPHRGPGGVGGGGAGSGGAGAGGTGTVVPTPRTQQERVEEEPQQQHEKAEEGSRLQQQVQLQPQQERVEEESRVQQRVQLHSRHERVDEESRPHQERQWVQLQPQRVQLQPQRVQLQPQQKRAEDEPKEQQQGQVPSQQTPEEAEQQRLRLRNLPDPAPARFVRGPLLSPPDPPVESLSLSQWTHRSPLSRAVSSEPRRSRYSPVFPLEVLEDKQFELSFLAAVVPHLCAMLLALEGDLDALYIPIPRTNDEAISGPWTSYWIAAKEAKMTSYRSIGTYLDAIPPTGANVVSGMLLYKVKQPPVSPPVFKARYVSRGFSQREGVDFFQTFAPTPKMMTL
ncbi:unnamed protein product [Closterium sp. NIES-54]